MKTTCVGIIRFFQNELLERDALQHRDAMENKFSCSSSNYFSVSAPTVSGYASLSLAWFLPHADRCSITEFHCPSQVTLFMAGGSSSTRVFLASFLVSALTNQHIVGAQQCLLDA